MSPGTYIRKRREAAGLSLDDVAGAIGTDPRIGELSRRRWLMQIEADVAPIGADVIAALSAVKRLRFDPLLLADLVRLHRLAPDALLPGVCRHCACSWADPCVDADGVCCAWVEGDATVCTACRGTAPASDAIAANDAIGAGAAA